MLALRIQTVELRPYEDDLAGTDGMRRYELNSTNKERTGSTTKGVRMIRKQFKRLSTHHKDDLIKAIQRYDLSLLQFTIDEIWREQIKKAGTKERDRYLSSVEVHRQASIANGTARDKVILALCDQLEEVAAECSASWLPTTSSERRSNSEAPPL
jgi:hypothetical protein